MSVKIKRFGLAAVVLAVLSFAALPTVDGLVVQAVDSLVRPGKTD